MANTPLKFKTYLQIELNVMRKDQTCKMIQLNQINL